jgi:hypothetical protein
MKTKDATLALAFAVVLTGGAIADSAQGAVDQYAKERPLAWGALARSSSGTLTGGKGGVLGGDFGGMAVSMRIFTEGVNSGHVYGSAEAGAVQWVTLTHRPQSLTSSRCGWRFSINIGGTFPVNCYRYTL